MSKWSSMLPKGCRSTSGFGKRWGVLHAGHDWGPIIAGTPGTPVFAPHAYTVIATGYGYGRAADRIPYHSGRFAWLDIGVNNGDRMRIYVGHLASLNVKPGDKGKAGDRIGTMGGSGSNGENHFAIHAHIGVSVNNNRPINAWNARTNSGWINPIPWFASKGIIIGQTVPVTGSTKNTASTSSSTGNQNWYTVNKLMRTAKRGVKIMNGRGTKAKRLATLVGKGYRVTVLERRNSWARIRAKGKTGWVTWLQLENTDGSLDIDMILPTRRKNTTVRSGRKSGTRTNIIGTAHAKGYRLRVLRKTKTWAQIRWVINGKARNAWIPAKNII